MTKLNLGSHNKRIEGYLNMDVLPLPNVDVIHDACSLPWPFPDNKFDEILAVEFFEHLGFRVLNRVLKECLRVLKPNGILRIQVPDIGKMCEYYVNNQISEEIPHKGDEKEILKLQKKTGKMIHPDRWKFALAGAQKHPYDTHLNHFTEEILRKELEKAGFREIVNLGDKLGWKLKFRAKK